MEAKTKKGLIAVGIVTLLTAITYFIFKNKGNKNPTTNLSIDEIKTVIWDYLSKDNPSAWPASYKEPYLSSLEKNNGKQFFDGWYLAIKNNKPNFVYIDSLNRKASYDTKTGIGKPI